MLRHLNKLHSSWIYTCILLIILAFTIYLCTYQASYEGFQEEKELLWLNGKNIPPSLEEKSKPAFCLLTRKPDEKWLTFLSTFVQAYDVYITIDDTTIDLGPVSQGYPQLYFLQVDNERCKKAGYWDSSYIIKKEVIAWDKALYYFCSVDTSYTNVWFSEDDVYLSSMALIQTIDTFDSTSDLLCKEKNINHSGETTSWMHWIKAKEHFDPPWTGSLQCICRMSRRMMQAIDAFVKENQRLNFIEILFTTIAEKNGLTITNPPQFSGIEYHGDHLTDLETRTLDKTIIYHAIKDVHQHEMLRNK